MAAREPGKGKKQPAAAPKKSIICWRRVRMRTAIVVVTSIVFYFTFEILKLRTTNKSSGNKFY